MKPLFLFPFIMFCSGFVRSQINPDSFSAKNKAAIRVLIINTFDAQSNRYRKNKKELYTQLADSLKSVLAEKIKSMELAEPVIIQELLPEIFDSKTQLDSLLNLYNASYAIIIKKLDAFFEQTGVDVTRDNNGSKSRDASYDICADVNYALYVTGDQPYHSKTKNCEYFSTRNVMSGFLAGGPDIVGKSKHAFKIIEKNAQQYLWEINSRLK